MVAMGEGALVVGVHAATFWAVLRVSWVYLPWMASRWRRLLANPLGLLVFSYGSLALLAAWEAAFYGSARVIAAINGAPPGVRGGLWTWIPFIAIIQGANGLSALLALAAVDRIDGQRWPAIGRRTLRRAAEFAAIGTGVAWWLW